MNKVHCRERGKFLVSLVTIILLLTFMIVIGASVTPAQEAKYPTKPVIFLAQSTPGSGFDTTTRAVANTLVKEKLVTVALPVENAPSSSVGPTMVVTRYKGDPYMISFQSISGMMHYGTGSNPYCHKDFTPLASLITTYYGIAVRSDSPYKTLGDLIKDLKEKPEKTPLTGGSSDDRVFYGAMFLKAGVDVSKINYVAYSGGTEASVLVLEGSGKALISTIDDVMGLFEAKKLRLLAVSSGKRLAGSLKDVPTLREAGVNMDWGNFRYALGGPNMPEYAMKYWRSTLARMVKTPTWQEILKKYEWDDTFMVEGFDAFLDEKQATITEVLTKLGMVKKK
jgi:putative tricarboxylic transport membrane protein